ncbi:type IV toxin-antitoxin system AbiEi family antitoxin domain-containing protein [Mycolicibacterium sp. CR10]|uniref:type IV toxin-antitoxin system AbiEi family antitoxin domain-containing protein n=1 Tax=Mycolicibacterium sp. CR10 TaxID=2562314 RepID=UPI0010BF6784|nr:type IV toxin-antitoxin system AbiEi family antitoxin domain-containing protein [Mycolicibacterium sp. CR10]
MNACPTCGRPGTQLGAVLQFVRAHGEVRPSDVSTRLGISKIDAYNTLRRLAEKGLIARVRHGIYSSDRDGALRRRALLSELNKLEIG